MLSENLPEGQSYQEFPDGHVEIRKVYARLDRYFSKTVRTLAEVEANRLLKEY